MKHKLTNYLAQNIKTLNITYKIKTMAFKMRGLEPINQRASAGKVKRQVRRAMRKGYDYDVDMNTGEVTRGARVNPKEVKLDPLGLGSTGKARRQRAKDVAAAYEANQPIFRDEDASHSVRRKKTEGLFNTVDKKIVKGSYDEGVETVIKQPGDGPRMRNASAINQTSIETTGGYQVSDEDRAIIEATEKRLQAQATAQAEAKADADVKANPLKNRETRNYESTATNIRQAVTPEEKAAWAASEGQPGRGRFNVTKTGKATRSKLEPLSALNIDPVGPVEFKTPGPSADINIPKPTTPGKKPDMTISGGSIYKTKDKSKTKTPKDTMFRDVDGDGNVVTRTVDKIGQGVTNLVDNIGDSIERGKRKRKTKKRSRNVSRGNCPPCPPCN